MKVLENQLVGKPIWLWTKNIKTTIVKNNKSSLVTIDGTTIKIKNISKQPFTGLLLENPVGEMKN